MITKMWFIMMNHISSNVSIIYSHELPRCNYAVGCFTDPGRRDSAKTSRAHSHTQYVLFTQIYNDRMGCLRDGYSY